MWTTHPIKYGNPNTYERGCAAVLNGGSGYFEQITLSENVQYAAVRSAANGVHYVQ